MGTFCYLRDVASNDVWSVGFQPTLKPSPAYEAIFSQSRAEFRRRDFELETHTEVTVSPEDDVELRRISITNCSRFPRTIELTSYAEVVLASAAADATHPAFSNLFVQTEIIRDSSGNSVYAPAPFASRTSAMDVAFNVRAWNVGRHDFL